MTGPTTRHLAEVPEADAPGPIRAIYQDIRRLTGVPMAALIFRHLATMPGVLEEAWGALGPLMQRGLVQETAWQLARETALPAAAPIGLEALAAIDVEADGLATVRRVVEAYNRANPVNHLGLLALAARARRAGDAAPAPARDWQPPSPFAALPPMVPPGEIPARLLALLASLSVGPDRLLSAVPSLYRHLIAMPGLLALFHVVLSPRLADGDIGRVVTDLSRRAEARADSIARHMPALPLLAARPEAQSAIVRFSSLIPQMVVIGGMLVRSLPAHANESAGRPSKP